MRLKEEGCDIYVQNHSETVLTRCLLGAGEIMTKHINAPGGNRSPFGGVEDGELKGRHRSAGGLRGAAEGSERSV